MYTDQTIVCTDCSTNFTFSASEQEFFNSKGFTNKPIRCSECRTARKAQRGAGNADGRNGSSSSRQREMFQTTCSSCGKVAEVPFEPRGSKPVYCRECFSQRPGTYR